MSAETIRMLRNVDGVETYEGLNTDALAVFMHTVGLTLPPAHVALLAVSNGLTVAHGYCRLFGLGSTGTIDSVKWNAPECWRFAWDNRCSPFWFFGETGWGDQYAYKIEDLQNGGAAPVYFLEGLAMSPMLVAPSFIDFLFREVVRNAVIPYHDMTRLAIQQFGTLQICDHVVFSPSLLLGATDEIENVQVMDAVTAMIFHGDIATQLDYGPPDGRVVSVETYKDDKNRDRIRLVWEETEQ